MRHYNARRYSEALMLTHSFIMWSAFNAITLVNDTNCIAGVCEVKLPEFDMDSLYQIVDYMANFHVRFVFGILTTYEKWRILWFEDVEFDERCKAGTANDYSIGPGNISIFASRVYDYSEVALVETLVSLLYKISMTPIASPQKLIDHHKKYIHAMKDTFTYESLPSSINSFSYKMPHRQCQNFYILQYYHRGGDGRVALCCSSTGNLCVVKFLLNRDGEEAVLKEKADLWNCLWGSKCRVVQLKGRFALLMPFCFHIRTLSRKPTYCGLQNWNRRAMHSAMPFDDDDVDEFSKLNQQKFFIYQNDLMIAAKEALTYMLKHSVQHDDLKWVYVALLPSFSASSDTVDLTHVLLDLTRTTQVSDTSNLLTKFESDLSYQLSNVE